MTAVAHNKISPTAKLVAYLRTFTDIPYSDEIAKACNASETFAQIVGNNPEDFLWTAPMIELRYKSIDAVLEDHDAANIIELASGVSPRGLIWTRDPSCHFLETDLSEILSEKIAITTRILGEESRRNLRWLRVDATNQEQVLAAEEAFNRGPIAIINEGLLPYLTHAEKAVVGRNILRLLKERSGSVWITTDVSGNDRLKDLVAADPKMGQVLQTIAGLTGRDIRSNYFASLEEGEQFFRDIGFKVRKWSQRELVTPLASLERVDVDPKKLEIMLGRSQVWALSVK
jgi:O-methyltransferase involved in polyketide biosynthesis